MKKSKKGFTLIELLVVIAIIGILSTIVLVSVNSVRAKARDSKRKANIRAMETALHLYYTNNESYPGEVWCDSSIGSNGTGCPASGSDWSTSAGIYTALVGGGYLPELPIDPINNTTYYYNYEPDCNQGNCPSPKGCCYYHLTARLEGGGTFNVSGY